MTRFFENRDGTELLPLGITEEIEGEEVSFLVRERAHPGELVRLDGEWRELRMPVEMPPSPGACVCVRCRRLNFGPCLSLTCLDLQTAPIWRLTYNTM